jgi:DNA-binding MarR family transcriptional regulator/YHS domain-containing protein
VRDPVCGMDVLSDRAAATTTYDGQTYYFCARACKECFDKAPEGYLQPAHEQSNHARALYEALGMLSRVFYGSAAFAERRNDLTSAEWEAVRVLGSRGECRMRELAEACNVALSTMTGIVDRLLGKGLVQRRHSTADRRVVLVQLSGRGTLTYEARLDADMRLVLAMLQALEPQDQHELVTLLQKIVRALPAPLHLW